jgi:2-aminoethylphosphonate transport system permease protein
VRIYGATSRGSLFEGAALAVVLMLTTLVVLLGMSRIRTRASFR